MTKKKSVSSHHKTTVDKEPASDFVNTLHHAIAPFLLIGQFAGILPVSGLREKDVTRVHFRWMSFGVLVAMVLIGSETIDLLLFFKILSERGLKLYTTGPVTFCMICLLGHVAFLRLACQWPNLITQFTQTEKIFLDKSYETEESKRFCKCLRLRGLLWLVGAVVEHSMYMVSVIQANHIQITKCNLTVNFWENFYVRERLELFSKIDFHFWMIPFCEWLNVSMTFTWNFIDLFLMLITSSLAVRFGQVNMRIRRHRSVFMTDEFWLRARLDFMSLLALLQAVDDHLSTLVLLSCTSNLYYICFQVFQSFQQRGNVVETVYFWYSLSFVLARILATMLAAASINDTSNDILAGFFEIPTDFWGHELERFYEFVASHSISISGKGFFFITRRLIFGMLGTVVTYELVLIDQIKDVVDRVDYCITRKV